LDKYKYTIQYRAGDTGCHFFAREKDVYRESDVAEQEVWVQNAYNTGKRSAIDVDDVTGEL